MKRIFVLVSILFVSVLTVSAVEKNFDQSNYYLKKIPINAQINMEQVRAQREKAFEEQLGLTDIQKLKAKELRKKAHYKIAPVMQELRAKTEELDRVKDSDMPYTEKEKRMTQLDNSIISLREHANKIRKANMRDFENILTHDQKKILNEMKKEGRERYKAEHSN